MDSNPIIMLLKSSTYLCVPGGPGCIMPSFSLLVIRFEVKIERWPSVLRGGVGFKHPGAKSVGHCCCGGGSSLVVVVVVVQEVVLVVVVVVVVVAAVVVVVAVVVVAVVMARAAF